MTQNIFPFSLLLSLLLLACCTKIPKDSKESFDLYEVPTRADFSKAFAPFRESTQQRGKEGIIEEKAPSEEEK